ncbi:MAG: hypothetical protein ACLRMJ_06180 [Alistipes finegoldii]
MESASSNIVAYKAAGVEVAANSEFLFKSGDESQWIGADAAFAGSSPYTCTIGSAFKVSADKVNAVIAKAGTYDYWLLPEAGRAYVMAAGAKPELVADTWGLVGNITGWGDLGDFSMSEEGAYLVRKGVALTTASEFKIRFNNAWDDSKNYGTASGGAVDINKAVDIITSGGSQNMKVQLDGTYDIYFDLANSQIYIMSEGKTRQRPNNGHLSRDGTQRLPSRFWPAAPDRTAGPETNFNRDSAMKNFFSCCWHSYFPYPCRAATTRPAIPAAVCSP